MAYTKKSKEKKMEVPVDECYTHFSKMIEEADGNTQTWSQKQDKFHRIRMRIKKEKTFPFVNCSNIRMPTAETKIRKLKAALINVIFGIRPVVQVVPTPSGNWQTAGKIEKFLDHLIMDVMDLKPKATIAVDQELEKGMFILKPYWKYECTKRLEELSVDDLSIQETMAFFNPEMTPDQLKPMIIQKYGIDMSERVREDNEKAVDEGIAKILRGEDEIKIPVKDVICDYPDVALCSPERIYVPTDSPVEPDDCVMVCHEFFIPYREAKKNVDEKGWDAETVEQISEFRGYDFRKYTDITKDIREGIERINNPSEQIKIWEVYAWYDLDGDGYEEKCVLTFAPEFRKTLKKQTLPNFSGKFPFVKLYYELIDDRWFSHRGIPELLEDVIKEIDIQHMQKIDQQTIRNTPMFMYRAGMVNPNLVQFMPNQGIPVHGLNPLKDTLDVINNNNPNVEFSYEREEQILATKIEELVGQIDFSLQSMINRRQPRTLGEVNLQANSQQNLFTLDSDLHVNQFSKLFNFIWDLWCQYGSDEYEFAYFGQEGYEPIKLSKEEVQGKYKITVRGNDKNTNPDLKLQKAQMIVSMTANPVALKTGIVTPAQLLNAYKRAYQAMDIPNWQELVDEKVLQPKPPQPPPLVEKISTKFEDLAEGEQAQVLQRLGIKPDVAGRAMEKQQENNDSEDEKKLELLGLLSKNGGMNGTGTSQSES